MPFTNVFPHGLIRDEFGRKMSKSRGNGIDPLDWVEKFGADARAAVHLARGASPGGDLSIGEDHARASRNFATKLFNATRFAFMNGASPAPLPDDADLTDADRWILGRTEEVRTEVDSAFDGHEFSRALRGAVPLRLGRVLRLARSSLRKGAVGRRDFPHHRCARRGCWTPCSSCYTR